MADRAGRDAPWGTGNGREADSRAEGRAGDPPTLRCWQAGPVPVAVACRFGARLLKCATMPREARNPDTCRRVGCLPGGRCDLRYAHLVRVTRCQKKTGRSPAEGQV